MDSAIMQGLLLYLLSRVSKFGSNGVPVILAELENGTLAITGSMQAVLTDSGTFIIGS